MIWLIFDDLMIDENLKIGIFIPIYTGLIWLRGIFNFNIHQM